MSLIFSIIAATSMRAAEILLSGFYPGLPRFALVRTVLSWVRHSFLHEVSISWLA